MRRAGHSRILWIGSDGVPRAGPFDQTQQLVGFAPVKDPSNDDGPADGLIRVEHSPVPHSETPRVLHRPFQVLDLPGLSSRIAINRLVYARPDRRIQKDRVSSSLGPHGWCKKQSVSEAELPFQFVLSAQAASIDIVVRFA